MADDRARAFAEAVLQSTPPGAVIVGVSVAPEGQRGAALTFLPTANYLMDDVFEYVGGSWQNSGGGSGGPGLNWTGADRGVLRFSGEAPVGAASVVVAYDGEEHRIAVNHGHFLFVAWDTPFTHDPEVVRFEY